MHLGRDYDVADPGEDEYYAIDFVNDLPSGATIANATAALTLKSGSDANPSAHLIGSVILVGTTVQQRIRGLTAGNIYTLQIIATTNTGAALSLWANIPCKAVF